MGEWYGTGPMPDLSDLSALPFETLKFNVMPFTRGALRLRVTEYVLDNEPGLKVRDFDTSNWTLRG